MKRASVEPRLLIFMSERVLMSKSLRFVVGYPQTQDEESASRSIVQAHAANRRWRKTSTLKRDSSDAGIQPQQLASRYRSTTRRHLETRQGRVDKLQESHLRTNDWFQTRRPSLWIDPTLTPSEAFSHSLQSATLPPPLPVEQLDLLSRSEVWIMLRKSKFL